MAGNMERISQGFIAKQCGISRAHLANTLARRKKTPWPVAKQLAKISGIHEQIWMDQDADTFGPAVRRLRNLARLAEAAGVPAPEFIDYMERNAPLPEPYWRRITAALNCGAELWDDVPIHQAIQDMENCGL